MGVVAIEDLGRHEVWCACIGLHMVSSVLGEAEIDETNLIIFPKHNVFRFYVTMGYSKGVAVLQRIKALADDIAGLLLGVRFSLLDVLIVGIKKLAARAQLHHEVEVLLVIVRFKILDDVGMVHFLKQIDLIHDVCQIFRRHLVLVEHFDSDLELSVHLVNAFVHFAEGALSKHMSIYFILHLELVNTGRHMNCRRLLGLLEF